MEEKIEKSDVLGKKIAYPPVHQLKLEHAAKLQREFQAEFRLRIFTFMATALGVVAALFWQTAITDTIKAFIPVSGAWQYEIFVAVLVTTFAVAALLIISKLNPQKQ